MDRSPVIKSAATVVNDSSSDEGDQCPSKTQNKSKSRLMDSSSSDEGKNQEIQHFLNIGH